MGKATSMLKQNILPLLIGNQGLRANFLPDTLYSLVPLKNSLLSIISLTLSLIRHVGIDVLLQYINLYNCFLTFQKYLSVVIVNRN